MSDFAVAERTAPSAGKKRAQQYVERFGQLQDRRQPWESSWKETTELINPRRSIWDDSAWNANKQGQKVGTQIYDTHAQDDLNILGSGLQSYNAGPNTVWFHLKVSIDELNDIPFVRDWLEQCENVIYSVYHKFGFYDAVDEYVTDLGSIGTASMLIEEDLARRRILFSTRHPKEIYLGAGRGNIIDTVHRKVWYTAREAYQRYGDALPPAIKQDSDDNPWNEYPFLHVVEPREVTIPGMPGNMNMPIASVEICLEDESIVAETGYWEMPTIVCRWRTNSDEWYGRSPGLDTLPELKKCNEAEKDLMRASQLSVNPPKWIPQEMRGRERFMPGGHNYYSLANRKPEKLDVQGEYPIGVDRIERWHQKIDDHFFTDLFLMLQRSQRQMTAREIVERQGEKIAVLSGPLSKTNSEGFGPMVRRTFNICMRAGWLPPPPAALLTAWAERMQGSNTPDRPIDVDFVGLLAQSQKRYQQSQGINTGLSTIAAIAEAAQDPTVWDNVNRDDLARNVMDAEGFPQTTIVELPKVKKIRAARAEQIAQQQQMEKAEQVAGMVPKLQKKSEPGSPAEEISKQMADSVPRQ